MATYFRSDGWVKSAIGPAVPGAQIFVCTQPANTPSGLTPFPPSPLANIFSDPNGVVPITQPIITDGFGHYDFYVSSGLYTLIVYLNGTLQQSYPDQSIGAIGTGSNSTGLIAGANITIVGNVISATVPQSITLKINGTLAGSQSLLNISSGTGLSITDNGSGTITFSSTGVNFSGLSLLYALMDGLAADANLGGGFLVGSTDKLYAYPFIPKYTFTTTKLVYTSNTSPGPSSPTPTVGVYDSNGNLLMQASDVLPNLGTTPYTRTVSLKDASLNALASFTFQVAKLYYIVFGQHTNSNSIQTVGAMNTANVFTDYNAIQTQVGQLNNTIAGNGAMPNPIGSYAASPAGRSCHVIGFLS